jgi:hypothetical protein
VLEEKLNNVLPTMFQYKKENLISKIWIIKLKQKGGF